MFMYIKKDLENQLLCFFESTTIVYGNSVEKILILPFSGLPGRHGTEYSLSFMVIDMPVAVAQAN